MASLLSIPLEILEQVLLELDPVDVAAISQICVSFAEMLYRSSSDLFWRKLYLTLALDDPLRCLDHLGNPLDRIDWRRELQRVIRARTIVKKPELCRTEERCAVWRTILHLATHTVPLLSVASDDLSYNLVWLGSLLRGGMLLEHSLWDLSDEERQLRAQFHTLFGLTAADFKPQRRVDTRCAVYALRRYSQSNFYGPFLADGSERVDWEHMLAIQHVMSMHAVPELSPEDLNNNVYIGSPMSLPFCNSIVEQGLKLDETEDWAGVEGKWLCSFCFCDHRDLLVFNNFAVVAGPLRRGVFEDPEFVEAFTVLEMHFRVTSTERDDDHPTRPIIHFAGTTNDSHAEMEGWVKLTPEGNIRWHFVSNQVWSSEGIQVGNIRSAFGILGIWTTVHHERSDPVGPFWLRKLMDK